MRRIAPLGGIAAWAKIPELEFYQLKAGTLVEGKLAGQTAKGKTFWGIPGEIEGTGWSALGDGHCEGEQGPLALEARIGKRPRGCGADGARFRWRGGPAAVNLIADEVAVSDLSGVALHDS